MGMNIALIAIFIASFLAIRTGTTKEDAVRLANYVKLHLFLDVILLITGLTKGSSTVIDVTLVIVFMTSISFVLASIYAEEDTASASYIKTHLFLDVIILIVALAK
ncbi:MAG: hypothetical protein A2534_02765 [Candidatus Magasanikbacteria bacterium RIFOXYD2_FULL_39_9]|uniref:Uncharacterized protein n=1 Tax=Candidatus Magasanikbacteria bacterium RIFOXYD1_FULL_40_23 TaxID=1798705 RepID=A0A1F6P7E4_9BACT|nr:MAG: hypothetical protein A2563_00740 [Candidatus Magasanikbacteria bacterium RIFOXYD1_FULL_40_23]OGH92175.1 MAG: hypothetical protein A2534_02765 [Candidatus Magasanikbacteria bacterium RIFOXYD2_FULL_39_9]